MKIKTRQLKTESLGKDAMNLHKMYRYLLYYVEASTKEDCYSIILILSLNKCTSTR